VPQWREKRVLFGEVEKGMPEGEVKEEYPPEERISLLMNRLDRTYKRLRRKLKREKKKGEEFCDPKCLRELEEINRKLEDLEEGLE
jgi:NurA-like 5'-3' nuclease